MNHYRQTVLPLSSIEAEGFLTVVAKFGTAADVVVYSAGEDFARSVANLFAESWPDSKVTHSDTEATWERGAVCIRFLVGPPENRICGRRRSVVVVVTDDGYSEAAVSQMVWLASI